MTKTQAGKFNRILRKINKAMAMMRRAHRGTYDGRHCNLRLWRKWNNVWRKWNKKTYK